MARGFKIPKRRIGWWAQELIDTCSASRMERIQRGAMYRNLYLTGDESGDPATYPKTFAYIDNLSSYLYSPIELRFGLEHYGPVGAVTQAKSRAGAAFLHRHVRRSELDMTISEATTWGLVKGKTFAKQLWAGKKIDPHLVQPEMMGVLNESVETLDRQEAFCHSTYITPTTFQRLVDGRRDEKELLRNVSKYIAPSRDGADPAQNSMLRQVILGGLTPYQPQGSTSVSQRGIVNWLGAPSPTFAPQLLSKLIRLDELWVWNSEQEDWVTIQQVGPDCVLEGKIQLRNIFADAVDTNYLESTDNPLSGMHPFVEFCPQPIDKYFWGRSELCNVGLLQKQLNVRINGVNALLRRQEDPPLFGSGFSPNQNAVAKLRKPGGFLADQNPNALMKPVVAELPTGLYESVNETLAWFADMGGFTPVISGQGESGVRSQGHAETLVRTSSPRFKDRALVTERSVEEAGGLALAMLKAHCPETLIAWLKPGEKTIEATPIDAALHEPPAPGMQGIEFMMKHLDPDLRVVVDAHSGSPAFSEDTKKLMFDLNARGAITPQQLIQGTHPPNEDEALAALMRGEISREEFFKAHPEALEQSMTGKKPGKKR